MSSEDNKIGLGYQSPRHQIQEYMGVWIVGTSSVAIIPAEQRQEILQIHLYLPAQCSYNECFHSHEALLSHISLCQHQELQPTAGKGVDG